MAFFTSGSMASRSIRHPRNQRYSSVHTVNDERQPWTDHRHKAHPATLYRAFTFSFGLATAFVFASNFGLGISRNRL